MIDGNAKLLAMIDELALSTTWSRSALEMWCRVARSYAKRRRLSLTDDIAADMLREAVKVATYTGGRAGSPEEFMALLSPSRRGVRGQLGVKPDPEGATDVPD